MSWKNPLNVKSKEQKKRAFSFSFALPLPFFHDGKAYHGFQSGSFQVERVLSVL
jgi:hypothetical protein